MRSPPPRTTSWLRRRRGRRPRRRLEGASRRLRGRPKRDLRRCPKQSRHPGLASAGGYLALSYATIALSPAAARCVAAGCLEALVAVSLLGVAGAYQLGPPSRRLADAPFVLLMLGLHGLLLAACASVARGARGVAGSPLLKLADRRLLAWFLAANVLCGATNFAVDTMAASDGVAVAVLVGYTGAVAGAVAGCPAVPGIT